jgi:hypothetical protein
MLRVRARRDRRGQSLLEIVLVVGIIAAIVGATILSLHTSRENAIGSYTEFTKAVQLARQEARGNTNSTGYLGSTLYLTTDQNGDAVASVYMGLAGSANFNSTPIARIGIPGKPAVVSGAVTSPQNLAILFASDGNLTYTTWTFGNMLTPQDCTMPLSLAFKSSGGGTLFGATMTCGSQQFVVNKTTAG